MLTTLMRKLFGSGVSGKRQAGWVMFTIVTGILLWIIKAHADGKDMTAFIGLMTIAWPTAMGAALGPHILHHLKPEAYK